EGESAVGVLVVEGPELEARTFLLHTGADQEPALGGALERALGPAPPQDGVLVAFVGAFGSAPAQLLDMLGDAAPAGRVVGGLAVGGAEARVWLDGRVLPGGTA